MNVMVRRRRIWFAAAVLLTAVCLDGAPSETIGPSAARAQDPPSAATRGDFAEQLAPFLRTYCLRCHGDEQAKGERRFDRLDGEPRDDEQLIDYQDVLDQLNLGEMPPAEAAQPSDQERRQAVRWLTERIRAYHEGRAAERGQTVLRRLNAREYRNSLRDLLDLNLTLFDPTDGFPRDATVDHLDNVGEALTLSGHLLQRYLDAAQRSIQKALLPREPPSPQSWVFRDGFRQQPEIDQVHRTWNRFQHLTLYEVIGADKPEGAYAPILAFADGVPQDGWYRIRFRAEALHREHPYDPKFLGTDPAEPLLLGVRPGRRDAGELHLHQPIEPLLAELPLADEPAEYEVEVWLDAGFTPRFTFRNGPIDVRGLYARLLRKYADQFPKPKNNGIVEARSNVITQGKLPQIRIDDVEIQGPLPREWPTSSQRLLLGEECAEILATGLMTDEQVEAGLRRFASRAFRRPVLPEELQRLCDRVRQRREAGRSPLDAYADALTGVLCSPQFLFLEEPGETGLTAHAWAARLSYFLWAAPPDHGLRQAADEGALDDPQERLQQVRRLLSDDRSEAFVSGFLDAWLTLRDLGATPPERAAFRPYYQYRLDEAMRRETELFALCLLRENRDCLEFLTADFTFVNRRLAEHYGLEPPAGDGFQRVALRDARRGGLLGQASVLTVTANGIDTSPVTRGVWLLENLLGSPPSPPPPDVEPLDPDIRGAVTIREQLAKHRGTPNCYDCHRKIDPLGFALENYDAIGGWRNAYEKGQPIDASGELPGGERFDDVVGLKALLAQRREQFTRALAGKLLAYAIGRPFTIADRPAVDRLLRELEQRGNGFADLVELIAGSETFASP